MSALGLGLGYTLSVVCLLVVVFIIHAGWDIWVYLWKLSFGSALPLLS